MGQMQVSMGRRVANARRAGGLSGEQLGNVIGVGRSTMSKIESGRRALDGFELVRLAEELGVQPRELVGLPPRRQAIAVAQRLSAETGDTTGVFRRARQILEFDGLLDELGEPGSFSPKVVGVPDEQSDPEVLARRIRAELGLGAAPIGNLDVLLSDEIGMDIGFEPLEDAGVSGLLVQGDGVALVLVNSDEIEARQRFTLAHELGHHLMDAATQVVVDGEVHRTETATEERANAFAAEFLMPAASMTRLGGKVGQEPERFVDAMLKFGVSREALTKRLGKLDIIDGDEYERLLAADVAAMFMTAGRSDELEGLEDRRGRRTAPARIVRRALKAYERGRIGLGPVASLLGRSDDALEAELASAGMVPRVTTIPVPLDLA